jgi:DNA-binding winged helix-turn-helix (wHTH) protein
LLPGYDHVEDRQIQVVSVKVHHIRKKLGGDAIENVWGFGYRLGARLHETLRDRQSASQATPMRLAA